jgi:hypothetical protein
LIINVIKIKSIKKFDHKIKKKRLKDTLKMPNLKRLLYKKKYFYILALIPSFVGFNSYTKVHNDTMAKSNKILSNFNLAKTYSEASVFHCNQQTSEFTKDF